MLINSTMENDMKPLKKTFSAPNKIPNTNAKKLLKISKTDENIACCAESSKRSENEAKKKTPGKHNHKLGQNISKQETRKPKSLTDKEYEEIFSNVIHALEIESFENSVNASKNENLPHNKNLTSAEKIDKIVNIEDAVGSDDNIVNNENHYFVDETSKKSSSITDDKAVDTDSIDSEDIDEWDNLSNSVKEKKKSKPDKKLNCKKPLTITKSKSEKKKHVVPEQLLNLSSDLPNSKQEYKKKKNLKFGRLIKSNLQDYSTEPENCCSNELEEKGTWVQCSNSICNKWRYLKDIEDPQQVPENWECRMNSDVDHNSCELPEVQYDETEHIFTKYTLGSVVWAKMDGYPWWPALIDNDPDYEIYFEIPSEDSMIPTNFHVTFFGNHASRAWIKPASIIPYVKDDPKSKLSIGHKKDITVALNQANLAMEMNLQKRIEKYGFTQNFTKKSSVLKKSVYENISTDENDAIRLINKQKISTNIDETNVSNVSLEAVYENISTDENDAIRLISENELVGSSILKFTKSTPEKSTCSLTMKPENVTELLLKGEKKLMPDNLNSELMNKNEPSNNLAYNSGTQYQKEKKKGKKDITADTKIKKCKLKNATCRKRKISPKRNETENTVSNKKVFKSKKVNVQVEQNANCKDEIKNNQEIVKSFSNSSSKSVNIKPNLTPLTKKNSSPARNIDASVMCLDEEKQEENLEKICRENQEYKSTNDICTSKAVKLETDKISALHEKEISHTTSLCLDKNHANKKKCAVRKKKQKSEEVDSVGLVTVDEVTLNKVKKKKKAFFVPITKNSQIISLCADLSDDKLLQNGEDNSRLVPDINVPVICEDIKNEIEHQSDIDLPFMDIIEKNNEKLDLECNLPIEDNKRVSSDDDSSDFILDIEAEDEHRILVDTLKEVEGRFGGHCFGHSLDSDPLDLIEE
ncbi:hypothetical protein Btru_035171 [Bulinus truncatus]|nr:hypothetical protein Btru_035171 [Bulinus truncatus]